MKNRERMLLGNLKAEMARRQITSEEMANAMGISLGCYYDRRSDPGALKLREMLKAAKLLKVDLKDLL